MLLFHQLGEGLFFLSQASLYLAVSPKSNSNKAIFKAIEKINSLQSPLVPTHLRNNADNYKNPHDYPHNWVDQDYLPSFLKGVKFWEPKGNGWEKTRYEELLRRKQNKNYL